eukprot:3677640-Amphidinium_carterae.1
MPSFTSAIRSRKYRSRNDHERQFALCSHSPTLEFPAVVSLALTRYVNFGPTFCKCTDTPE